MKNMAILCDYEWCTGCKSCEMACQMEHGLPIGKTGIKVEKIGPWPLGDDENGKWQIDYLAIPTDQCDTCAARREMGKDPTCVKHCQARCLYFGTFDEMSNLAASKGKQALFVLREA